MMTPLQPAEITRALLVGKHVFASNNEPVGCVSDVHGSGSSATIFVDLGGILCLDGRTIELVAGDMEIGREENGAIMLGTALTVHQLEMLPAVRL
ncbi:hypothetical protein [Paracoccus sp. IB05]|uniref:hypothetical protein n=1 Tax=Paracoccus sp. IB05 TaxID=2779367 RepID=UPI0018E8E57C|nr:hypothetical protein [Paracoccus sp. IB05]MBJ2149792.1 hypothetical protein [Paracoccus sp. IB05]